MKDPQTSPSSTPERETAGPPPHPSGPRAAATTQPAGGPRPRRQKMAADGPRRPTGLGALRGGGEATPGHGDLEEAARGKPKAGAVPGERPENPPPRPAAVTCGPRRRGLPAPRPRPPAVAMGTAAGGARAAP